MIIYNNDPMCYRVDCLFNDCVYCTHDLNLIVPNSTSCKWFTLSDNDKNFGRIIY